MPREEPLIVLAAVATGGGVVASYGSQKEKLLPAISESLKELPENILRVSLGNDGMMALFMPWCEENGSMSVYVLVAHQALGKARGFQVLEEIRLEFLQALEPVKWNLMLPYGSSPNDHAAVQKRREARLKAIVSRERGRVVVPPILMTYKDAPKAYLVQQPEPEMEAANLESQEEKRERARMLLEEELSLVSKIEQAESVMRSNSWSAGRFFNVIDSPGASGGGKRRDETKQNEAVLPVSMPLKKSETAKDVEKSEDSNVIDSVFVAQSGWEAKEVAHEGDGRMPGRMIRTSSLPGGAFFFKDGVRGSAERNSRKERKRGGSVGGMEGDSSSGGGAAEFSVSTMKEMSRSFARAALAPPGLVQAKCTIPKKLRNWSDEFLSKPKSPNVKVPQWSGDFGKRTSPKFKGGGESFTHLGKPFAFSPDNVRVSPHSEGTEGWGRSGNGKGDSRTKPGVPLESIADEKDVIFSLESGKELEFPAPGRRPRRTIPGKERIWKMSSLKAEQKEGDEGRALGKGKKIYSERMVLDGPMGKRGGIEEWLAEEAERAGRNRTTAKAPNTVSPIAGTTLLSFHDNVRNPLSSKGLRESTRREREKLAGRERGEEKSKDRREEAQWEVPLSDGMAKPRAGQEFRGNHGTRWEESMGAGAMGREWWRNRESGISKHNDSDFDILGSTVPWPSTPPPSDPSVVHSIAVSKGRQEKTEWHVNSVSRNCTSPSASPLSPTFLSTPRTQKPKVPPMGGFVARKLRKPESARQWIAGGEKSEREREKERDDGKGKNPPKTKRPLPSIDTNAIMDFGSGVLPDSGQGHTTSFLSKEFWSHKFPNAAAAATAAAQKLTSISPRGIGGGVWGGSVVGMGPEPKGLGTGSSVMDLLDRSEPQEKPRRSSEVYASPSCSALPRRPGNGTESVILTSERDTLCGRPGTGEGAGIGIRKKILGPFWKSWAGIERRVWAKKQSEDCDISHLSIAQLPEVAERRSYEELFRSL